MIHKKTLTMTATFTISLMLNTQQMFAHSWMAPVNEAKIPNPIEINEISIENGKTLYLNFCSTCHGSKGIGIAKEITALKIDTPNLPNRLKSHSDGDFHWKIKKGKDEMPSFKEDLTDKEIWNIINYIKSLVNQ